MSEVRRILVVGATGQQGGSVLRALTDNPPSFPYEILALTRSTNSKSAKALASKPNVTLIKGDLDNPAAIFEQAGGKDSIWGVFLVTIPTMKAHPKNGDFRLDAEAQQGMAMVDAAIENGVQHFVFSSVDRGGDEKSWTNPTNVPHFITKHLIEVHLRDRCEGNPGKTSYTILRPVAFMDNYMPGFIGRAFAACWAMTDPNPLQFVSVRDVGIMGAKALTDYADEDFKNQAFGVAGDQLTQAQANEVLWDAKKRPMTQSYWFVASLLRYMVKDFGIMFNWFKTDGFGVDVEKCRRLNPQMQDFKTWLKQDSKIESW